MNNESYLFLRVIAGKLKGRTIDAPKGGKTVRPISDRVKEALFDILAPRIHDARILDLFSGTGAIGFESISRGAKNVIFVEHDPRNITLIRNNALKLEVSDQIKSVKGEMPGILKKIRGTFDIVFMDPPFAMDIAKDLFPIISGKKLLDPNGIIVLQRDRRSDEIEDKDFILERKHKVGDSILYFYTMKKEVL